MIYNEDWALTKAVLMFIISLAVIFLNPLIAKWIWNAILPDLFHFPVINYWQMFWLNWLIGILFRPADLNKIVKKGD